MLRSKFELSIIQNVYLWKPIDTNRKEIFFMH